MGHDYCRILGLSAQITSHIFSYTWNHVPSVTGKGCEVMTVPFVFGEKILFSAKFCRSFEILYRVSPYNHKLWVMFCFVH